MSSGEGQQDSQAQAGAPRWMLTYSDVITLLLTFFVLLMTFSTSEEEKFGKLASGFSLISGAGGVLPGASDETNLEPQQRRLRAGRLTREGAETPPIYGESPISSGGGADVDIDRLPELTDAFVIRIPLKALFASNGELSPEGKVALEHVVKLIKGRPYNVTVRARGASAGTSSVDLLPVIRRLRERSRPFPVELRLSNDIDIVEALAERNVCEILLMGV